MSDQSIPEQTFDLDAVFDNAGSGSGVPSYEWPKQQDPRSKNRLIPVIGGSITGEVTDIYVTVVKDPNTKEPKLDRKGRQQPQVNLTIQTEHRNWENVVNVPRVDPNDPNSPELPAEEDTGERRIYVKYKMLEALAKAIKGSEQKSGGPRKGAQVAVRVKDLTYDKDPLRHPLPDYEAAYKPPVNGPADDLFNQQAAAQQQAAPAQQDPWTPTGGGFSDEPAF